MKAPAKVDRPGFHLNQAGNRIAAADFSTKSASPKFLDYTLLNARSGLRTLLNARGKSWK